MGVFVFMVGWWEKRKGSLTWFSPKVKRCILLVIMYFCVCPNFLSATSGHFSNQKLKQLLTLWRIRLKIEISMEKCVEEKNEKKSLKIRSISGFKIVRIRPISAINKKKNNFSTGLIFWRS